MTLHRQLNLLNEAYKAHCLDEWDRGVLTTRKINVDLKFYKMRRRQDNQRRENLLGWIEGKPFHSNWIDWQISKLEREIQFWDQEVEFLQWLLKQPRTFNRDNV